MLNKLVLILILGVMVAGCGRLSAPKAPEGSTYNYPYGVSQDDQ